MIDLRSDTVAIAVHTRPGQEVIGERGVFTAEDVRKNIRPKPGLCVWRTPTTPRWLQGSPFLNWCGASTP